MEELILVDLDDTPIGAAEKLEAHTKGLLHRAFSLFVVCDGHMLIHQRAKGKYHSGGLWTNAVCSHPRTGENLEDAVVRRGAQELGLELKACPQEAFNFIYRADFGDLSEYEFDHVFIHEVDARPALRPDPEEIGSISWVSFDELSRRLLEEPASFTAWFITAAPKVLSILTPTR